MYREMNSISQHQNRLFEKLGAQIKSLDLTFDGVIDDLNGIKDMFIIMESFLSAQDQNFNHLRRCSYCLLSGQSFFLIVNLIVEREKNLIRLVLIVLRSFSKHCQLNIMF